MGTSRARALLEGLNRRNGMPVFNSGDVAAQQTRALLNIALR
jgi:hypothetical protein